jgi:hypothetical protein
MMKMHAQYKAPAATVLAHAPPTLDKQYYIRQDGIIEA